MRNLLLAAALAFLAPLAAIAQPGPGPQPFDSTPFTPLNGTSPSTIVQWTGRYLTAYDIGLKPGSDSITAAANSSALQYAFSFNPAFTTAPGAKLFFPAMVSWTWAGVVLPDQPLVIECGGKYVSTLQLTAASNTYLLAGYSWYNNLVTTDPHLDIHECGVTGQRSTQTVTSPMLLLRTSASDIYEDYITYAYGDAIELTAVARDGVTCATGDLSDVNIHNDRIRYSYGRGVYAYSGSCLKKVADINFFENDLASNGSDGTDYQFYADWGYGVCFHDNKTFNDLGLGPLYILNTGGCGVYDNRIDESDAIAIGATRIQPVVLGLTGSFASTISNNTFKYGPSTLPGAATGLDELVVNQDASSPVACSGNAFRAFYASTNAISYTYSFGAPPMNCSVSAGNSFGPNVTPFPDLYAALASPTFAGSIALSGNLTVSTIGTNGVRGSFGAGTITDTGDTGAIANGNIYNFACPGVNATASPGPTWNAFSCVHIGAPNVSGNGLITNPYSLKTDGAILSLGGIVAENGETDINSNVGNSQITRVNNSGNGQVFLGNNSAPVSLAASALTFSGAAQWSPNGAVSTSLTGSGPTGSHTTVQEWLTVIDNNGATRYVPSF